jgi:hypothetical protein
VDHLVRQYQSQLRRIRVAHGEQSGRVGIVVACNLLGVQVEQQRSELQRIREQAEQLVGRFQASQLRRRQLLVQLPDQVGPDLFSSSKRHSGTLLEAETGRALHGGLKTVDETFHNFGTRLCGGSPTAGRDGNQDCHPKPGEETKGCV